MISFLIPTCNFDCTKLVKAIWKQADALRNELKAEFDFEIIVSDDASNEKDIIKALQNGIASMPDCHLVLQPQRLGRASNRNALIRESRFPWKIFMDADAEVYTTNFVACYWESRNKADVICGSILPGEPRKGCELRYRYELLASENMTAERRNKLPYHRFTAFNVMLGEKASKKVCFDENCKEYGHEDTLFGMTLLEAKLTVLHIDNPLVHTGIDTNAEFLEKTETALKSLSRLPQLQEVVGSSRIYKRFRSLWLTPILTLSFRLFKSLMRRNLLGRHPSIFLLNCYKLLFYSALKQ